MCDFMVGWYRFHCKCVDVVVNAQHTSEQSQHFHMCICSECACACVWNDMCMYVFVRVYHWGDDMKLAEKINSVNHKWVRERQSEVLESWLHRATSIRNRFMYIEANTNQHNPYGIASGEWMYVVLGYCACLYVCVFIYICLHE